MGAKPYGQADSSVHVFSFAPIGAGRRLP